MRNKKILKSILSENYSDAKRLVSEELFNRANVAVDYITKVRANEIMNLNKEGEY